eukprot:304023_1
MGQVKTTQTSIHELVCDKINDFHCLDIINPDTESIGPNAQVMHPPTEWAKIYLKTPCFACDKRKNEHHCRLCGEMFCSECSTQNEEFPTIFRKKKGKDSVRVCIDCRYKVRSGVRLETVLTPAHVYQKVTGAAAERRRLRTSLRQQTLSLRDFRGSRTENELTVATSTGAEWSIVSMFSRTGLMIDGEAGEVSMGYRQWVCSQDGFGNLADIGVSVCRQANTQPFGSKWGAIGWGTRWIVRGKRLSFRPSRDILG